MLIKKNYKISGYVLVSITSILLIVASLISTIIFYQKKNLTSIDNYQELRELKEQIYALQKQTLSELEISVLEKKHFNRNTNEKIFIEGENDFQHIISIQPLDGCVNLTALIYKDLDGKFRSLELEKERFEYIFQQLNFDDGWVNTLIDYQDSDMRSSSDMGEQENGFKNLPFLHLSEIYNIIPLSSSQRKTFQDFFCVNQINRKFNIKAMSASQISKLFPFLNPDIFEEYLMSHDYQNLNSVNEWEQLLVQFLKRSLTPKEKKYLKAISLENKTLEMLVRSSKKGLNWFTKMKFEMSNQNEIILAYQLGPYLKNE